MGNESRIFEPTPPNKVTPPISSEFQPSPSVIFLKGRTELERSGALSTARNVIDFLVLHGDETATAELALDRNKCVLEYRGGVEDLPLQSQVGNFDGFVSEKGEETLAHPVLLTSWGVRYDTEGNCEVLRRGKRYSEISAMEDPRKELIIESRFHKGLKNERRRPSLHVVRKDEGGWTPIVQIPEYLDWRKNHPDEKILPREVTDPAMKDVLRVVGFVSDEANRERFRNIDSRTKDSDDSTRVLGLSKPATSVYLRERV